MRTLINVTLVVVLFVFVVAEKAAGQVSEEWLRHYHFSEMSGDSAFAVAVDHHGRIAVTGISSPNRFSEPHCLTIQYDANGQERWVQRFSEAISRCVAIAIDADDNVYVTGWRLVGPSTSGYVTIKYDAEGTLRWAVTYRGSGVQDMASSIAVDADGNVTVTGTVDANSFGWYGNYGTVKYDSTGREQWVRRYPGNATALAVDSDGNIYVTGRSPGIPYIELEDYVTIKYDADGEELWVALYDGPGHDSDSPIGIAVDPWGDVVVAGTSYGDGTGTDYATVKYDAGGEELWVARFDQTPQDIAMQMAMDAAGHIVVSGLSHPNGLTTVTYDTDGSELWVARDQYVFQANGIAIDEQGDVYIAGQGLAAPMTYTQGYVTAKYSGGDGSRQWRIGLPCWPCYVGGLALDSDHNVYVTGDTYAGGRDIFKATTVKYSQPYR